MSNHIKYTVSLAADATLATTPSIAIGDNRYLSAHVEIDNGTASGTPTDSPVGVWELYISADGENFKRLTSSAITTSLAAVAAVGNTLVSDWVMLEAVPGAQAKLLYNQTSGGSTSARATVNLTSS